VLGLPEPLTIIGSELQSYSIRLKAVLKNLTVMKANLMQA